MEARLDEFDGLPEPDSIGLEAHGREVGYFCNPFPDGGVCVLVEWQSPNGFSVSVTFNFDQYAVATHSAAPAEFAVCVVDDEDKIDAAPVVDAIPSTSEIEHEQLRDEVEWALGVVKGAAAERRASDVANPHPETLLESL